MTASSLYKVFIIDFMTPYQVKYHGIPSLPEEIIDASIVLRSIVYASALINDEDLVDKLVKAVIEGRVRSTSILPVVRVNDRESVPLIPFPVLLKVLLAENLAKGNIKVLRGINYTTPKTLTSLLKHAISGTVEIIEKDGVKIRVNSEAYSIRSGVLISHGEENVASKIKSPLFYYIDFIRNRIDRLSNASDPYHSSYIMPSHEMYFMIEMPKDNEIVKTILSAIKLLEDIGIGSKKSLGLGKFKIKEIFDLENYSKELYELINNSDGYWTAMGKFYPEETVFDEVFYESDIVAGVSGHIMPYKLPALKTMLPGATVGCMDEPPKGLTKLVEKPGKSIIVFNPIFYGIKNLRCSKP